MRVLKTLTPEENGLPAPRFSPDGRYVAYGRIVDAASKQEDIFLIPLDGGPEIPLIEGPANEDIPRWMPDGNNLLFRGNRRGEVWDSWMIRVVDGKPVGPRRLVAQGTTRYLRGPVRTPTGGWAFYYSERGESKLVGGVYLGALDPDSGKLLNAPKLISRPTTGTERVLSPEFSPDGKYLAYYVAPATIQSPEGPLYGPGNIVIRSLETGQERQITLSPRFSHGGPPPGLRWNPNGLAILMRGTSEAGRIGLFQVELATGKLDPLVLNAEEKANWQSPSRNCRVECDRTSWGEYSPDGATVFFIRSHFKPDAPNERTHWRVMARDLQTGEEKEICRNPEGDVGFCAFAVSPDGLRLLIGTKNALWIVPTDGGEPRELLRFEGEFNERIRWTMTWTPDSRHVLFVNGNQGGAKLWRIAADGGPPEQVGELPATSVNYRLGIHPDGRQIAFVAIRRVEQGRLRMMQMVVSDELAKEMCTANLRKIGKAIEQYKNDHGDVPDGFADLYPDYLQNTDLLLCPADHSGGKPLEGAKDPKTRCSYAYMFGPGTEGVSGLDVELPVDWPAQEGMTWKDARKLQLEYFGSVVPTTRCVHHRPSSWLFLSYDGEVYEAKSYWERSPRAEAGLLSKLKSAMQSEPDTWARRYGIDRFYCTLKNMRKHHSYNLTNRYPDPAVAHAEAEVALTKLLKTHLKEHPQDDAATESLAELPRLRFPYRYYDDAEEYGEGQMYLDSYDLELTHDNKRGDQVVGIRFQDTPVPQGAQIKRAYVQFTAYPGQPGSEKTDLVLHAELAANAEPFAKVKHNITSRRKTAASVKWSPEPWTVGGARLENQRTPDLSSLIQEVVDQPDWHEGNALVFVISGSGRRTAQSHDGSLNGQPTLYVEHEATTGR
ncbi:MAG: hypothetical protein ABIP48_09115 [Planctomycetota bacterium]